MAATVAELIDRGVKAYLAGRVKDALAAFQAVLALDPGNAKARGYIVRIHAVTPASTPLPGTHRTVTPAPGGRVPTPRPAPWPQGLEPAQEFAPSPWDDGPATAATYVVESGGGLDLGAVSEKSGLRPLVPERPPAPAAKGEGRDDVGTWLAAARELLALGDYSGSLELIEKILQLEPEHPQAREYLAQNEATLVAMYESKLGSLSGVPHLAVSPEEVLWLNLDHRAGFLLAQIDGAVDYGALFALSGLPRLDTARILARLLADGVIAA
jgi:tetratricopeptide (TPR) repeat protein